MAKNDKIDFDDLKKNAAPITDEGPELDDDEDVIEETPKKVDEPKEYTGPGVVIDKLPTQEPTRKLVGPMADKDRQDAVTSTLREMDEQIHEEHKRFLEIVKNGVPKKDKDGKVIDPSEVTVLIDKLGYGDIVFTDEEKQRIERAKKIKLVEVTNKELQTVKIAKKFNKETQSKYIQRSFNRTLAPVIALASGYTAKMKNVSAIESIQMLQRPGRDSAKSVLEKWSLIYNKLTEFSCGDFKDFDDFISHTAYVDYNNFIYAMLCSSYPDDDVVSFTCNRENCGKTFEIGYKNKDIIRKDLIGNEQADLMAELIEVSGTADIIKNKEYADENAPVGQIERFPTDNETGILIDITIPSVKEQCERIIPSITPEMQSQSMRPIVVMAHNIKSILIPADDSIEDFTKGEYIEADEFGDIVDILSQMNSSQWSIIGNRINRLVSRYTIRYGLKQVVCPHCGFDYGEYPMDLEEVFFQRVQQQMMTELE